MRRVARPVLTALLIVGVLTGSAGLHHADDDLLCGVDPIHDASAHRIRASHDRTSSGPSHCFLCHWQRSFRTVLIAVAVCDQRVDVASSLDLADTILRVRVADLRLPARAPPA